MNIKMGKSVIAMGLFFFFSSCFYIISPLRRAEKALKKGQCEQARRFFTLVQDESLKFAEKAAKSCRQKAFKESLWFYQYLSLREKDKKRRRMFEETLAELYFEDMKNYEKSLETYFFLREQSLSETKNRFYSFRIALSYFESGKWTMSLKEVNMLLSELLEEKKNFRQAQKNNSWKNKNSLKEKEKLLKTFLVKAMFLKARILLMQEKYKLAEKEFRKIQQTDLKFFKENNLFFYLSFIYESRKEFHPAILELEKFQSTSDFLADKVKRLKIRKSNQPGSAFRGN